MTEAWDQWRRRDIDGGLVGRADGTLPEMECTKQLVKIVAEHYRPGMTVLDVGCNAGHYLRSLRALFPDLEYLGVDINPTSIEHARRIFADDQHARFELADVHAGVPSADLVFCCNVILHQPDFRPVLRNLLAAAGQVCITRTLLHERTTLAQRIFEEFPEGTTPEEYYHLNTWSTDWFRRVALEQGWQTAVIDDEFDPAVIAAEFETVKQGDGARMEGGVQADGPLELHWRWTVHTRG